ncbi:MAG: PSD1 and planctomycete cytochrome C domain-containing protein [Pirellulales bacterium]
MSIALSESWAADESVEFGRDVQPILARRCFTCHGPDEENREAELRLDSLESIIDSGLIVPGVPGESELLRRVQSNDPDERMPPPDAEELLSEEEQNVLRDWITEGAVYSPHWAFVPPAKPQTPDTCGDEWPRNDIDHFILTRLRANGLRPSPEADRHTLLRRVYLDLIGLPPMPQEVEAFVNNSDPQAYEKVVDRLLNSEHYGERWARLWLDLARYSDTNGYEKDRPRSIWKYRDWVVHALNTDMPFDRFTVEQLAGDMLPDVTESSRIATGFHRNTMLNEEGGIDPLEFRFYSMIDRVATTGAVWLGLTVGCAQCHSHKYDPISQLDFYRMMSLLNNAEEQDLVVDDPAVTARRRAIEDEIKVIESKLPELFPPSEGDGPIDERRAANLEKHFNDWLEQARRVAIPWTVLRPDSFESNLPKLEVLGDGSVFSTGDITKRDVFRLSFRLESDQGPVTAIRLEALPDSRLPNGGPGRAYYEGRKGDFFLSEFTATFDGDPVRLSGASHSYGKISIGSGNADASNVYDGDGSTGWSTAEREGEPHHLVLNLVEPLIGDGELDIVLLFERHFAASLGRFRISVTAEEGQCRATERSTHLESLITRSPETWSEMDRVELRRHYLRISPELASARQRIEELQKRLPKFPTTMVMQERPEDNPRRTFLHHRGEYLALLEEVTPGVPSVFAKSSQPTNRLEFARWLVSDENPLVARVTVNRSWRALFGAGLVRTSADFGTQSEPPTHPDLLDWLACELVDRGWSIKHLHRLIVTSATYRQSSHARPDALVSDPHNRLLGRGPRYRVDAEVVRDMMLRASGLISTKLGGPGVYPPQPSSVTELAYGNTKWTPSTGEERYRRSLYTFSKRTAPFASYAVFDAPSGEICQARRDRSNSPLQALTLLNDEMFVEMAQALARAVYCIDGLAESERATLIFRRLVTRPPTESELSNLLQFRNDQLVRLEAGELDAEAIADVKPPDAELASWVMVARAVMNLDETITKN